MNGAPLASVSSLFTHKHNYILKRPNWIWNNEQAAFKSKERVTKKIQTQFSPGTPQAPRSATQQALDWSETGPPLSDPCSAPFEPWNLFTYCCTRISSLYPTLCEASDISAQDNNMTSCKKRPRVGPLWRNVWYLPGMHRYRCQLRVSVRYCVRVLVFMKELWCDTDTTFQQLDVHRRQVLKCKFLYLSSVPCYLLKQPYTPEDPTVAFVTSKVPQWNFWVRFFRTPADPVQWWDALTDPLNLIFCFILLVLEP